VLTVPFEHGKPVGSSQDFLTGFVADEKKGEVYGRPVGVAVADDGSLLVTDDAAGIVWRVAAEAATSNAMIGGFESPESALQVPDGRIFVSEIGESGKVGDGRISLVTPTGKRKPYVRGLDDPKGLAWWGDMLYVADVKGVYRIDRFGYPILMAGIKDFPAEPTLLNDLAVTQEGTLYVSDTGDLKRGGGAVYSIDQSGMVERVLGEDSGLKNPNGLLVEKNHLLVADFARGELHRVELASLKATIIAERLGAADGVVKTTDGRLYVSDWRGGEIFRIGPAGRVQQLDTADRFGAAADIHLTHDGNYLMVPDMKTGNLTFMPL
jgi:outer membrane protein assembly factor BamB